MNISTFIFSGNKTKINGRGVRARRRNKHRKLELKLPHQGFVSNKLNVVDPTNISSLSSSFPSSAY